MDVDRARELSDQVLWDEYWKDDPRSQISKVIDRLDGNVPDTIECLIESGLFWGGNREEQNHTAQTVAEYVWDLLEAYKVNNRGRFNDMADQLCMLLVRGMETSE